MAVVGWLVVLTWVGQSSTTTAADSVTLRDGHVVVGQVLDSDRRGPLMMVVRRAWLAANLPDRSAAWESLEAPTTRKAEAQRRERLQAWRRDRRADPAGGDRITPWIDLELARLAKPDPNFKTELIIVKLGRAEVKAIDRKPRGDNRLLRLGWLSNFADVESMPLDDLKQALEGRGFSVDGQAPISVDALLPAQPETEAQWLTRRAATEVVNDSGGRLLRYQGLLMAEPAPGEAPQAGASLDAALGTLKGLLGEAPVDPLPAKLRELTGQGRGGVIVTKLDISPDFSGVAVETTLWVRAGERWVPAIVRASNVRPDDLPPNAGAGLAEDPQVKAAFGLVEKFGIGEIPPELKRRSLNMGAATRQALGQARGALDLDLDRLGLSLEPAREPISATNVIK